VQTWWGKHTWRPPSGNAVNYIHNQPEAKQLGAKYGSGPDFQLGPPKSWTGSQWWDMTHHQCTLLLRVPKGHLRDL